MCAAAYALFLAILVGVATSPMPSDSDDLLNSHNTQTESVWPENWQKAGSSPLPIDMSQLQSGFGPLMNTMKSSKLVVGGFSFLIIPNLDPTQLQGVASGLGGGGGLPFVGAVPGSGR